jgi:hypothetical protein
MQPIYAVAILIRICPNAVSFYIIGVLETIVIYSMSFME